MKDSCSHRGICRTQRENTILLLRLEETEIDVKAKNQLQRERLGPGPEHNREIKLRSDRLPAGAEGTGGAWSGGEGSGRASRVTEEAWLAEGP